MGLMDSVFGPDSSATSGAVTDPATATPSSGFDIGNVLGALGKSLMTSPGNNPLKNFGTAMQQTNADVQKQALLQKLKAMGMTDQQIALYSSNPTLLATLLGQGQGQGLGGNGFGGGGAGLMNTPPSSPSPAGMVGGGDMPNLGVPSPNSIY